MKYFIGHLIEGEAVLWHNTITKDIAEKFNIWKMYEKGPPHITIFYPFETEDIGPVANTIKQWLINKNIVGNFSITDFGYFDNSAVFATVRIDPAVKNLLDELKNLLTKIPGMPEDRFPLWQPHATLAYKISPEQIKEIWAYTHTLKKPNFINSFSNITIFRFENEKQWVVDKYFKLETNK